MTRVAWIVEIRWPPNEHWKPLENTFALVRRDAEAKFKAMSRDWAKAYKTRLVKLRITPERSDTVRKHPKKSGF